MVNRCRVFLMVIMIMSLGSGPVWAVKLMQEQGAPVKQEAAQKGTDTAPGKTPEPENAPPRVASPEIQVAPSGRTTQAEPRETRRGPAAPGALPTQATPARTAAPPEQGAEEDQYVTMDFDGVDIKVFIKFIADITARNFIIDDKVTGKVTVISPRKMTLDEAYQVFLSVLEVNGYGTVPAGSVIKVVKSADAITKSLETTQSVPSSHQDRMVTQIIPLTYADSNDMRTLLSPLMSKGTSQMLAYPQSNVLIVTDVLSNIKKILDILKVVDVPGFAQEVRIFPLSYATATDLSAKLTQILAQETGTAQRTVRTRVQPGTLAGRAEAKIIPDERTNALIVLASALDMKEIEGLIERIDIPTPTGKEDVHVYYLQYANAEDLSTVLSDIPTPESPEATAAAKAKSTTSSGKQSFKISPDKETNSLIIYADPHTYRSIVETIKYLDIPRKQVYVKALIMEVKTDKDFKVGVEWTAFEDFEYDRHSWSYDSDSDTWGPTNRLGGVIARTGSSFTSASNLPAGALLGVVGEAITIGSGDSAITFPNLTSFINAMAEDTDVNIISTPQIITMDNKEAEIVVGANVPYVTRETTDSTNISNTVRTFDYRDVGVTLRMTPQINQQGTIRMDIFQEITTLVEGTGEQEYAPTTLKRSATTTVTVKDGTTLVIGGLIGDTLTLGETRVPLLGRIPVLGWLFKSKTRTSEKTNLFIFVTPAIIDSDEKVDELYRQKYGEVKSLEGIFQQGKKEKQDANPEP